GNSGALGVKEVVKWLNRNGYRTRRGETFGVASVHKILTNTVYIGQWKFNKTSSRTRQRKPDAEVVTIPVPSLIEPHVFGQVQRQLHADRLNSLKADRDRANAALEIAKSHVAPAIRIDPALIERFGRSMREKFTSGSVPFRKAYLQSLIDVVEIDDHRISIKG